MTIKELKVGDLLLSLDLNDTFEYSIELDDTYSYVKYKNYTTVLNKSEFNDISINEHVRRVIKANNRA